jgi:hypothetical protein
MIDEATAIPEGAQYNKENSSLARDYFHDVGLFRGKELSESIDHIKKIIESKKITGTTQKGAQVSQNHGPTNWESPLSLRIKGIIPNIGPDTNSPPYANWYGTGSKSTPIDLSKAELEVVVNGNSKEEIEKRKQIVKEGLKGLDVKIADIESLANERFTNIANHFKDEEARKNFMEATQKMDISQKKQLAEVLTVGVGGLLAERYQHLSTEERSLRLDTLSAETIESLIPQSFENTYRSLPPNKAEAFYNHLSSLPYHKQVKIGLDLIRGKSADEIHYE